MGLTSLALEWLKTEAAAQRTGKSAAKVGYASLFTLQTHLLEWS